MASKSYCFPYEKSIVINALYDIIESLGLFLESSNAKRGTLIVCDEEHIKKMHIMLRFCVDANQTKVEVFAEDSNESFAEMWRPVIFDELAGRMKWIHQLKRGETTK